MTHEKSHSNPRAVKSPDFLQITTKANTSHCGPYTGAVVHAPWKQPREAAHRVSELSEVTLEAALLQAPSQKPKILINIQVNIKRSKSQAISGLESELNRVWKPPEQISTWVRHEERAAS